MDSPEGQRLLIAASFGLAANLLFFSLFRYRARVVVATKRAMERLALPTDPALVQVQRASSSDHVSVSDQYSGTYCLTTLLYQLREAALVDASRAEPGLRLTSDAFYGTHSKP
eukprot:scaffold105617_cov60-Phaeocystis_antarctica.AAC.3